jgi:hypothetical protein
MLCYIFKGKTIIENKSEVIIVTINLYLIQKNFEKWIEYTKKKKKKKNKRPHTWSWMKKKKKKKKKEKKRKRKRKRKRKNVCQDTFLQTFENESKSSQGNYNGTLI